MLVLGLSHHPAQTAESQGGSHRHRLGRESWTQTWKLSPITRAAAQSKFCCHRLPFRKLTEQISLTFSSHSSAQALRWVPRRQAGMLGLSANVITSPRLVLQGRALRSGETWVKFRVFTGGKEGLLSRGPAIITAWCFENPQTAPQVVAWGFVGHSCPHQPTRLPA